MEGLAKWTQNNLLTPSPFLIGVLLGLIDIAYFALPALQDSFWLLLGVWIVALLIASGWASIKKRASAAGVLAGIYTALIAVSVHLIGSLVILFIIIRQVTSATPTHYRGLDIGIAIFITKVIGQSCLLILAGIIFGLIGNWVGSKRQSRLLPGQV